MKDETLKNISIDKGNAEDFDRENRIRKMLLLGAGESGKSTLFKQMLDLYGTGFTDKEIMGYINVIANNLISAAKALVENSERLVLEGKHECSYSDAIKPQAAIIKAISPESILTPEIGAAIKAIWCDSGIKATYALRYQFHLPDGSFYILDHVEDYVEPGYRPTKADMLFARIRTTGVIKTEFSVDDLIFQIFDVGGQRNERKKWIHCFENVSAVIFVAAISEYDQLLFEDDSTNRLIESLNLFEEVCNSRWFKNSSIILFLNKSDLFLEKLPKSPLSAIFPEYEGGADFEKAWQFISEKFASRRSDSRKKIYTHVTCATDDTKVRSFFSSVKEIVVRSSMESIGPV